MHHSRLNNGKGKMCFFNQHTAGIQTSAKRDPAELIPGLSVPALSVSPCVPRACLPVTSDLGRFAGSGLSSHSPRERLPQCRGRSTPQGCHDAHPRADFCLGESHIGVSAGFNKPPKKLGFNKDKCAPCHLNAFGQIAIRLVSPMETVATSLRSWNPSTSPSFCHSCCFLQFLMFLSFVLLDEVSQTVPLFLLKLKTH